MSAPQVRQYALSLRHAGTLIHRGEFALDHLRARETMRKFQHGDPYDYVLELVQLAHLLGASHIAIRLDTDEFDMRFDGALLNAQDFKEIYAAAFASRTNQKEEALKHLAFAIHAVMGLAPIRMLIESGNTKQAHRLTLETNKPDTLTTVDRAHHGTRIYIKEGARPSHVASFFQYMSGNHKLMEVLSERCCYADIPVIVNGEVISARRLDDVSDLASLTIQTPWESGHMVLRPKHLRSTIVVLQHGVTVTTYDPRLMNVAVYGVVDTSRLQKDLSQRHFVQDVHWFAFLDEVITQSIHMLIEQALRAQKWSSLETSGWAQQLMLQVFKQCGELRSSGRVLPPKTRQLALWLETVPMWPAGDAGQDDKRFRAPLIPMRNLGVGLDVGEPLHYVRRRERQVKLFDDRDVLLPRLDDVQILTDYLQVDAIDQSQAMAQKVLRMRNHARWRFSEEVKRLSVSDTCLGFQVAGQDYLVHAEIRQMGASASSLKIIHQHRQLKSGGLPQFPFPRFAVTIVGSWTINAVFDDVVHDALYAEAVFKALMILPEAMSRYALETTNLDHRVVVPFLQGLCQGDLIERILLSFGLNTSEHATLYARWWSTLPEDNIWHLIQARTSHQRRPEEVAHFEYMLTPWLAVPLFNTLQGHQISLSWLFQFYQSAPEQNQVVFVFADEEMEASRYWRQVKQSMYMQREEKGAPYIVVADDFALIVLTHLFGSNNIQPYLDTLAFKAKRTEFMRKFKRPLTMSRVTLAERRRLEPLLTGSINQTSLHGEIAMLAHPDGALWEGRGVIWVLIHHARRFLIEVPITVPVGIFVAIVDTATLKIESDWQDVVRDGAFEQFCASIKDEAASLVIRWVQSGRKRLESHDAWVENLLLDRDFVHLLALQRAAFSIQKDPELYQAVRHARLFKMADGESVSYDEMCQRWADLDDVHYTQKIHPSKINVVYLPQALTRPKDYLHQLMPDKYRVLHIDHEHQTATQAAESHQLFLERPSILMHIEDALATHVREDEGVHTLVGWHFEQGGNGAGVVVLRLCHMQRQVMVLTLPCPWGHFEVIVDDAHLVRWQDGGAIHEGQKRWHRSRVMMHVATVFDQYLDTFEPDMDSDVHAEIVWMLWRYLGRARQAPSDEQPFLQMARRLAQIPMFQTSQGVMSFDALDHVLQSRFYFALNHNSAMQDEQIPVCLLPSVSWYKPLAKLCTKRHLLEWQPDVSDDDVIADAVEVVADLQVQVHVDSHLDWLQSVVDEQVEVYQLSGRSLQVQFAEHERLAHAMYIGRDSFVIVRTHALVASVLTMNESIARLFLNGMILMAFDRMDAHEQCGSICLNAHTHLIERASTLMVEEKE